MVRGFARGARPRIMVWTLFFAVGTKGVLMARLEELTRGASIKGILPDGLVTSPGRN